MVSGGILALAQLNIGYVKSTLYCTKKLNTSKTELLFGLNICTWLWPWFPGGGGDLVSTLPGCVCRKVKDMGLFSASSE